jgi:hypothetical protein
MRRPLPKQTNKRTNKVFLLSHGEWVCAEQLQLSAGWVLFVFGRNVRALNPVCVVEITRNVLRNVRALNPVCVVEITRNFLRNVEKEKLHNETGDQEW